MSEKIEDEVNLIDYVRVLIKKKWLILGITLGAAVLAAVLTMTMPKTYEVNTILEVGKTGDGLIETPGQLAEKIKNGNYNALIKSKLNLETIPSLEAQNPQNTNLVIVSLTSPNPQEAVQILNELNNNILAEHQKILNEKEAVVNENIKDTQAELIFLETQKEDSDEGIASLRAELSRLKDKLNSFELTKVSKAPVAPEKPTDSNLILNVIIALVLGLFIGIFVAFIRNWWEKEMSSSK